MLDILCLQVEKETDHEYRRKLERSDRGRQEVADWTVCLVFVVFDVRNGGC